VSSEIGRKQAIARSSSPSSPVVVPVKSQKTVGRERQIAERSRSFCHRSRWAVQRSPGGAATPSRSIADEATQRRYRQHFLGRDPLRASVPAESEPSPFAKADCIRWSGPTS